MSGSDTLARAFPIALALALAGAPARAEDPMTADEFESFSLGKTLDYTFDGKIYGSEAYLPNRRVLDADTGGPCHSGRWKARGDEICFIYDGSPTLHCWRYWRRGDSLIARPSSTPPDAPPDEVTVAPAPLTCSDGGAGV